MSGSYLHIFQTTLVLTDGTRTPFEFTASAPENACRGAVANFQKQNPTKRVEYAEIKIGDDLREWVPHLEGWRHEQPAFINQHTKVGTDL